MNVQVIRVKMVVIAPMETISLHVHVRLDGPALSATSTSMTVSLTHATMEVFVKTNLMVMNVLVLKVGQDSIVK